MYVNNFVTKKQIEGLKMKSFLKIFSDIAIHLGSLTINPKIYT